MTLHIRPEISADAPAIRTLVARAFAPMPFAGGDEQEIPDRLRAAGRLSLSLVAVAAETLVGHAAFSRLLSHQNPTDWYALGPLAVAPERQRAGLGSALIRAGLEILTRQGARGFALTGSPLYYARFGFQLAPQWAPPTEPAQYFQVLASTGEDPPPALAFDPLFYV
jgi:putative acetyltransferase